jgi:hypothetical protein
MLGAIYCTRDEFGVDLYHAVSAIGSILGLQDQIAGVIHREEAAKLPDLKARRETLRTTLSQYVQALTKTELAQLLQRFPIVATL